MRRIIKVTEEDIREGRPRIAFSCPVARALQRELKDDKIFVGCSLAMAPEHTMYLPAKVTQFIAAYDKIFGYDPNFKIEPFEFEIEVPPPDGPGLDDPFASASKIPSAPQENNAN